jgi:Ca2+-binding EF-hand superfamily protein
MAFLLNFLKQNAISALRQAINVFDRLFEYLDNDRDGFVDKRNVKFGVSFVTNKNIDSDDVDRAFDTYDSDKDGKMNKKEFILASMNDGFLKSVQNPTITTSFFT